ncbi:hypothetical protein [Candidatus Uabimicrobium sp. HlEnr_7]|uniref:hypothetical protein n=1 Tax=Candidatus Uabimicrobium helgolandensis TaxID=3095367 RepID=UPI003558D7D0
MTEGASYFDQTFEADQMFFEADQKIKDGHFTDALKLLYEITDRFPEYGRAYNHLGYLFETKYQNYNKAEFYYRTAIDYAPEYPATYLNYAVLLSTCQKFAELEELLNKALEVPGINREKIYCEMGIMKELQKKYDEAIKCFKQVIVYCLSSKSIDLYQKNIERCLTKKDICTKY